MFESGRTNLEVALFDLFLQGGHERVRNNVNKLIHMALPIFDNVHPLSDEGKPARELASPLFFEGGRHNNEQGPLADELCKKKERQETKGIEYNRAAPLSDSSTRWPPPGLSFRGPCHPQSYIGLPF